MHESDWKNTQEYLLYVWKYVVHDICFDGTWRQQDIKLRNTVQSVAWSRFVTADINLHRKYTFFINSNIWPNIRFHIMLIEIIKAANAVDNVTGI